ncbi:hypothetical protein [Melissospora conviva]|uniref:hypothetical protein n=1 Tax=Melissospora conviva TaxID=3388432 RepID=UPI003B79660A
MGGYVNPDCGGWTELRVHGVSGTPPEEILQHPHVRRVAGDAEAGFYRRRWESPLTSADTADDRQEAYSWGGLTAGKGQRALWLLLTPFLLANIAYWALPYAADTEPTSRTRRATEALQRLFALSLTHTLVLATVGVSMDLIGWQCAAQSTGCPDRTRGLGPLTWSWLDQPGRQLAVTALVPLAVVGLLWWLANKTWRELETTSAPATSEPQQHPTPLEDHRMWNGESPVRRLRAVHISAGFALVALFLLAPFTDPGTRPAGPWQVTALILLALTLLLLALTVVLTCLPAMSRRDHPDQEVRDHADLYTVLPWLGAALAVAAAAVIWQPAAGTTTPTAEITPLPGLATTVGALTGVQLALLAAVVTLLLLLRTRHRRTAGPDATTPAWFGLTTAAMMTAAATVAVGFAAGGALTVAHTLGTPAPAGVDPDALVLPLVYFWAAALTVPVTAGALLLAAVGVWLVRHRARAMLREHVIPAYPGTPVAEALADPGTPRHAAIARRARRIATDWSWATAGDLGGRLTGAFALWLAAVITAGLVGYLLDPDGVYVHTRWAVNIGDALVVGLVAGLLYVGRQAYRSPRFRRTVGVLWDLGTFWPRATHPLAPPCYAERAVPDLVRRIDHLGRTCQGQVLLSCHSQGSVIGAAVVLQLNAEQRSHVGLLTYGSPLRRLYARFFPAYLGTATLRRVGALLAGESAATDEHSRWPWRNLYRLSDPIGGWVLHAAPPADGASTETTPGIDRRLVDPVFAKPPGDNSYPPTRGHSGYPEDPAYRIAAETVRARRRRP